MDINDEIEGVISDLEARDDEYLEVNIRTLRRVQVEVERLSGRLVFIVGLRALGAITIGVTTVATALAVALITLGEGR